MKLEQCARVLPACRLISVVSRQSSSAIDTHVTITNQTTGADAFLSLLVEEGVGHLFGNPGTTELALMNALPNHPALQYVLGLQEGVVVAMADGFSRASGKLTACNVHVAPGLGNAMGSLYNAKWFGSPMIVTAGQQERGHGLTEPLLYDPLVPIAAPLVKWAVEVERFEDLPRIVHRAAKVATTPPTGPVFISLPGDVLNTEGALALGSPTRVDTRSRPIDPVLETLAARILAADNPVVVAGHEIATGDAFEEAARFAEVVAAPVYQQTVPYGAHFPSEHPCFMGALTRSQPAVRERLSKHDLLICVGSDVLRMSVWNPTEALPDDMPIVQIGLRDWEMGKNYPTELAVRADIKQTLAALTPLLDNLINATERQRRQTNLLELAKNNWSVRCRQLRTEVMDHVDDSPLDPRVLMLRIVDALPNDAVVVDESIVSGQSLLSFLPFTDPRCFFGLSSGGIGFAVAGAIGMKLAQPERPMVVILGDGSSMYNIQALWTAAHLGLQMTYVIANNQGYRILRERLTEFHGNTSYTGMRFEHPSIDFQNLARSFGVRAERVASDYEIGPALERAAAHNGPSLIEAMVAAA